MRGFTLIEVMIIVAIVGIVMVTVITKPNDSNQIPTNTQSRSIK
jgi:prepilin-type N-terminal cleavage/methylation domain-containing protein